MDNKIKIIDLEIIDDLEESGTQKISLVDSPAIEKDWMYFKKVEKFVEPEAGESQSDYMGRCVPAMLDEGKPQDQAVAICISTYENFKVDTSGLAPYTEQAGKDEEEIDYKSVNFDAILEKAKTLGFSSADLAPEGLEAIEEEHFDVKLAKGYTVYKYEGPISSNSRRFCREMVGLDRFYTFDEINQLSATDPNPGFGLGGSNNYSIFKYKGGALCNHYFRKYYVTESGKIQNKGAAPGLAGTKPTDMPNRGYAFASEDKRELVGIVAIPDVPIYRRNEEEGEYYVRFSKDVIRRMAEKFLREKRVDETNIAHENIDAGTYVFESWIIENEQDKANSVYGLDAPVGSWAVKMRVTDDKVWEAVKAGKLRGFSLEGSMVSKEEKEEYEKDKKLYDDLRSILKD